MHATRLDYRPALDGLRAVAVLAVMLYHGQVGWLPGGFLGVDVFFVLSGYLITSLLVLEHRQWGSIDLMTFWLRRARRLLPALFLVLAAVALYGAFFVATDRLARLRGDAVATLLYVANWRFAFSGQSYFDQFQEPSPLRHMWSLGIEEQFYWIFPLLLMLWFGVRRTERGLGALMLLAAGASALLMAVRFAPGADPSRLYYGTDTRAQGLMVGAALAMLELRPGRLRAGSETWWAIGGRHFAPTRWRPPTGLVGVVGLIGLAVCFALTHESDSWLYRGGFLVVAVLSVAAVRAAAAPTGSPVQRLLARKPLRAIGVISYGLYLWHWPVFVAVSPSRTGLDGPLLLAVRFVVTFSLATLSFRLVESPIRQGVLQRRFRPAKRAALATTSVAIVLGIVLVGTAGAAGAPTLNAQPQTKQVADASATTVFLVGDSVAFNLRLYFPTRSYPGLSVAGSTFLGCGLTPVAVSYAGVAKPLSPECPRWSRNWPDEVRRARPDVGLVMVGVNEQWDHVVNGRTLSFGGPVYERHLFSVLDTSFVPFREVGSSLAVTTVPCHRVLDTGTAPDPKVVNDDHRVRRLNDMISAYAASRPDVHLLDLYGLLCREGYVDSMQGTKLRIDGMHFTPEGAALIWRWLAPRLKGVDDGPAARPVDKPGSGL